MDKSEKRAFFFDIDGTLFKKDTGISEGTKTALRRLRQQGDYVFFSTGRTPPSIDTEFGFLDYDGYVGGNGSIVVYHGRPVLNLALSEEIIRDLIAAAEKENISVILEGDQALYCDDTGSADELFNFSYYKILLGEAMKPLNASPRWANKLTLLTREMVFHPEHYSDLLNRVSVIIHEGYCVEIGPKYCSKASGCRILTQSLGIPMEQCYAFGDSRNDLDILSAVGHGVAMGDALEEVKERAKYVTETTEEDGISKALDAFDIWK